MPQNESNSTNFSANLIIRSAKISKLNQNIKILTQTKSKIFDKNKTQNQRFYCSKKYFQNLEPKSYSTQTYYFRSNSERVGQ